MRRFATFLLVGWLALVGASTAVQAEENGQTPARPVVAARDVETVIKGLASLKDYDRLQWILTAAEQQTPGDRADLLRLLDQQIDQLIGAASPASTGGLVSTTNEEPQIAASDESMAMDSAAADPQAAASGLSNGDAPSPGMPLRLSAWQRQSPP